MTPNVTDAARERYLELLGITRWELRERAPGPAVEAPVPAAQSLPADSATASSRQEHVVACVARAGDETGAQSEWMVVSEAADGKEGEQFAGAAGELLDKMLLAAGRARDSSFEVLTAPAGMQPHIERIAPGLILCMGQAAANTLLGTTEPMEALRARVHHHPGTGTPVVVTLDPVHLLRNPADKRKAWEDLKLAMRFARGDAA